jgi:hypothetical protein
VRLAAAQQLKPTGMLFGIVTVMALAFVRRTTLPLSAATSVYVVPVCRLSSAVLPYSFVPL